ncbi:MAG: hypothetical protein U0790_24985 [Isosphaeraceae bacterium]
MRTLFLLVAAIAVWLTSFVNRRQNAFLRGRIEVLQPLAHELLINDPRKIAVVKLEEYWYDDNSWDIHLPPGAYRLCLATREIDSGLASARARAPLPAGRHRIALDQQRDKGMDNWRVTVTLDGTKVLDVIEPKDWDPGRGSSGGGQYAISQQFAADQPLVLFRRRFDRPVGQGPGQSATPQGPCEGILLWIEPTRDPNSGP